MEITQDMIEEAVLSAFKAADLDVVGADAVVRFLKDQGFGIAKKDTIPNGGVRDTGGRLFENGPFSLIDGDLYSTIVGGGSSLTQWVPTSTVTHRFDKIKHLEWVSPQGHDGSQTYSEYLAGQAIDECGYGPEVDWSGFEYDMQGGSFSFKTGNMKPIPDGGVRYYEQQPTYTVRGTADFPRQQLTNDRDWAIARTLMAVEQHLDWNLIYGNLLNSQMEWDGLNTVLVEDYVSSRVTGSGIPHWAQPVVYNGATITTAADLLTAIRQTVRRIRNRLSGRNITPSSEDMVVYMPATMWDNIAEAVAFGLLYAFQSPGSQFSGRINWGDFMTLFNQVKNSRVMDVDGMSIGVLPDARIGINTTIDPGGTDTPGISGPVAVLTRRAGGDMLLEQQFIDYSQLTYPADNENTFNLFGGIARAGWVTEANKCFYYYTEMSGRLTVRGIQYQGIIRNAIVPTLDTNEHESVAFTNPDFFAYGQGNQGGRGTSYLTPV